MLSQGLSNVLQASYNLFRQTALRVLKQVIYGILYAFYNILSTGKYCNIYLKKKKKKTKKKQYPISKKPWHCALIYCKKP